MVTDYMSESVFLLQLQGDDHFFCVHTQEPVCAGQRTLDSCQFSPSPLSPEIKLRLPGLAASSFNYCTFSPALGEHFTYAYAHREQNERVLDSPQVH